MKKFCTRFTVHCIHLSYNDLREEEAPQAIEKMKLILNKGQLYVAI